jgi:membrane protease YdiL (CAAX protease family)
VEYHRVLAGEERRIGRGVLAIVLLVGGMFAAVFAFSYLGVWIDERFPPDGTTTRAQGFTPVTFACGLIATALLIPWSMVIQRWLYGVPGASLHSVVSRFRFEVFGRALLALGPAFVLALVVAEHLEPGDTGVWSHGDVMGMLAVVLLLIPLQAAGEEYGLRGLVLRVAASWGHGRWASLILGIGVSSAVFAVIHAAPDPWWNVNYVVVSIVAGFITWRTGGVETAAVIHALVNTLLFVIWIALGADLAERTDRSPGSLGAALMVSTCLVLVAAAVVVWLRTRTSGPATTPSEPLEQRGGRTDSTTAPRWTAAR